MEPNNIPYYVFDSTNKNCLSTAIRADNITDFLNSIEHSFAYVVNADTYFVKTFREGIMHVKPMKNLPKFFDLKLEYEENGKKRKKTKKDIFKENMHLIKILDNVVFRPYGPNENPLTKEENLNLFTGFPYDKKNKKKTKINMNKIEIILNHMKILTNHDDKHFNYLLCWLASIIQNPNKKTGVLLVFKSDQGAGKSSFFKWIGNKIVGKDWFLPINNANILIDNKFNSEQQNKIFTMLDEAQTNGKYILGNERMKTEITEEWLRIEYKGMEPYIVENRNNFVLLTNNDFPVKIDYSDRRYCCFNCSNEKIGDKEYFKEYFEILNDESVAEEFFLYLSILNIKNFHCEDIPETNLKTQIRIDSAPTPIKYALELFQTGYIKYGNDLNDILTLDEEAKGHIDSKKLYNNYKSYVINKCPNNKLYEYNGFIRKLKDLTDIKSEKSKNLGEITIINKQTLKDGLINYFNIKNINEILNEDITYDDGYETSTST